MAVLAKPDEPTTVRLADGTTYAIQPPGPWGTFSWAKHANHVALAYRQIGDADNAAAWDGEYQRRRNIWDALERGADRAAIARQAGLDLLRAPVLIAADVGRAILGAGGAVASGVAAAGQAALGVARWVPLLVLGALIVLGIGLARGTLTASVSK